MQFINSIGFLVFIDTPFTCSSNLKLYLVIQDSIKIWKFKVQMKIKRKLVLAVFECFYHMSVWNELFKKAIQIIPFGLFSIFDTYFHSEFVLQTQGLI